MKKRNRLGNALVRGQTSMKHGVADDGACLLTNAHEGPSSPLSRVRGDPNGCHSDNNSSNPHCY